MGNNFSFNAVHRVKITWGNAMPKVQHIVLTANIKRFMHEPLVKTKKVIFSITQNFVCDRISGALYYPPVYLSFRISSRHASGSTPQNKRRIAGDVARGQLIKALRVCV